MSNCQRCGMCCKGRGDLAYGCDSVESDCPELSFVDGLAVCGIQDWKPSVCMEYPFDDMDNGMCEREQKEAGVWMEYVLVEGKLGQRDMSGNITMCQEIK